MSTDSATVEVVDDMECSVMFTPLYHSFTGDAPSGVPLGDARQCAILPIVVSLIFQLQIDSDTQTKFVMTVVII